MSEQQLAPWPNGYYASDDTNLHGTWTVRYEGTCICVVQESDKGEELARMIADALNRRVSAPDVERHSPDCVMSEGHNGPGRTADHKFFNCRTAPDVERLREAEWRAYNGDPDTLPDAYFLAIVTTPTSPYGEPELSAPMLVFMEPPSGALFFGNGQRCNFEDNEITHWKPFTDETCPPGNMALPTGSDRKKG